MKVIQMFRYLILIQVPTNVRQRYLDSIIEECLKIYNKDESKVPMLDIIQAKINRVLHLHLLGFNRIFSKRITAINKRADSNSSGKFQCASNTTFFRRRRAFFKFSLECNTQMLFSIISKRIIQSTCFLQYKLLYDADYCYLNIGFI